MDAFAKESEFFSVGTNDFVQYALAVDRTNEKVAEYYKPYHRRLWGRAKELAPHLKVQLHSCGAIEPLLEDLIEAGLDAVNPVQISCSGMDAAELKQKYGGRLTLWGGGCDTRDILPNATPDEIRRHVREQCGILNSSGGFVFQQVHNIMANIPPENIVAMFDAIAEFNQACQA